MSDTVSLETARRLRRHAGLEGAPDQPRPSISDCTWPPAQASPQLNDALSDLLETLERLNHELNGDIPSEQIASTNAIPRDVVYAITEIIRFLRGAPDAEAVWMIETAWSAVLAGDIDDLQQHLDDERWAR